MSEIFKYVDIRDGQSVVQSHNEYKKGFSLRDMYPRVFNKFYPTEEARKIHDSNFAFVTTTLSKLHETVYEPMFNTTYAKDIPIEVGGGLVDFVDFYSVDWNGMPSMNQNITGNNINVVPRVNAKLNHTAVDVFNFEIAYDIKFIEIDKLNKVQMQKSIEAIYKDAIMAGWEMFCDELAYVGRNGSGGLFNHPKVVATSVAKGTGDVSKSGFKAMTDSEIVGFINGVLSYYLTNSNNNIEVLPDTFLMPMADAQELSSRFSTLYTATLREFLMNHNVGIDEAAASDVANYKIKLKGRGRLNGMGTSSKGRVVAYKNNKKFVRMDIPYPMQLYYTAPNVDKAAYTTYFVGQASLVQLPYNDGTTGSLGAVTYWDLQ